MKKLTLILVLVLSTSISSATTLRTQEHTLKNPRIIIAGGFSSTDTHTLTNVLIGSLTSGLSSSTNYSIDVTEADQGATDTVAPIIDSFTPPDDGVIYEKGDAIELKCEALDHNLPLYYRFTVGNEYGPGWSLVNTDTWNTTNSNIGLHQVIIEAKDIGQNKTSATSEVYLINKPVALPILGNKQ